METGLGPRPPNCTRSPPSCATAVPRRRGGRAPSPGREKSARGTRWSEGTPAGETPSPRLSLDKGFSSGQGDATDGTCEGLPSPHLWTLRARPFATWVKWCLPFQLPREQEGRAGPARLAGVLLSGRSSPEPLKCTSSCHFPISDLDKPQLTLKACTPHRDSGTLL